MIEQQIEPASRKAQEAVEQIIRDALASTDVESIRQRLADAEARHAQMRADFAAAEARIVTLRADHHTALASGQTADTALVVSQIAQATEAMSLLRAGSESFFPTIAKIKDELAQAEKLAISVGCSARFSDARQAAEEAAEKVSSLRARHLREIIAAERELAEAAALHVELEFRADSFLAVPTIATDNPELMATSMAFILDRLPGDRLDLSHLKIGDAGVQALVACPAAAKLHTLKLQDCGITDDGLKFIADAPYLTGLRWLDVFGNQITGRGGWYLLNSMHLPNLARLSIPHDHYTFGDKLFASLCQRFPGYIMDGSELDRPVIRQPFSPQFRAVTPMSS